MLAPFWTDLNPAVAGGAVRIGVLQDGIDTWIVVDWAGVSEFSDVSRKHSFQAWIGVNTDTNPGEDITYAYGPIGGNGDLGRLTVGAENQLGNSGDNYYVNGVGTLPANGTQLVVTTDPPAPGASRIIRFTAKGARKGKWRNCAEMTADVFFGTSTACFSGEVKGRHRSGDDCDDDAHDHHDEHRGEKDQRR